MTQRRSWDIALSIVEPTTRAFERRIQVGMSAAVAHELSAAQADERRTGEASLQNLGLYVGGESFHAHFPQELHLPGKRLQLRIFGARNDDVVA